MLGAGTIIITLAVMVITYLTVNFTRFYFDVRRRARHILKFPGVDPLPLVGHLLYVSFSLYTMSRLHVYMSLQGRIPIKTRGGGTGRPSGHAAKKV